MATTVKSKEKTPRQGTRQRTPSQKFSVPNSLSIHSFIYEGRYFAFDPTSCSYFEINELTHEVIKLLKFSKTANSTNNKLQKLADIHGKAVVNSVLTDLQKLSHAGYFAHEEQEDPEQVDRYITALVPQVSSSIKLDVSEACNLACRYCYAEGGSFGHTPMLMTKEVAKKAVDLLFKRTAHLKSQDVGIIFLGGEPLVNLEVIKFTIDYSQILAKEYGKRVGYSMTTNATLLNDEAIDLITKYRIGIKVSVDGPKEIHDDLRPHKGGKGSFDEVILNIRKLVAKRGYPPAVRATITNKNRDINDIAEFLEKIGFNLIGFGYAEGSCFEKGELDLRPEDVEHLKGEERQLAKKVLAKLERGEQVKFNPYGKLLQKIHHRVKTKMRCGYARGTITVAADGKIYPCPLSPGKREHYVIGDVWNGMDPSKIKSMVANYYKVKQHCNDTCWARNICGGPCPTYVAHESGDHLAPDSIHCDFVRSGYEFGIWFYQKLKEEHPDYLDLMLDSQHS